MDINDTRRYIIIGISGATNSGKTTLVSKLQQLFPNMSIICQDHYFYEQSDQRLVPFYISEIDHFNWDHLGALDMDSMLLDVIRWRDKQSTHDHQSYLPLLVIEGFLIFNHSVLMSHCDAKFFLEIDKDACLERRRHRDYDPPDCPGYFDMIVWPMYLLHKTNIESQQDIVYLDGTMNQDYLVKVVADDIQQLITRYN